MSKNENKKNAFRKYVKYDYAKYVNKLDSLKRDIEKLSNKSVVDGSAEVVTSATWHNEHNQESYGDTTRRLQAERTRVSYRAKANEFKKWIDNGLFQRRLEFENGNKFYITTASVDIDYDFDGDFIVSYWGTNIRRVESLMKFDIGDISPKNGELIMCGDFSPNNRDLTNLRYKNIYGKHEFKSAKDFLEGKETIQITEKPLIDTENFFRLKFELANIGDQSKALYDSNSAIIDGAAGTGKSTISLQKLKRFHISEGIPQEKMAVIVKNRQAISYFRTLLDDPELKLYDTKIHQVSEFLGQDGIKAQIDISLLVDAKKDAQIIKKEIEDSVSNTDRSWLEKHFSALFNTIGVSILKRSLEELLQVVENNEEYSREIIEIDIQVQKINNDLLDDEIDDEQKLKLIDTLKNKKAKRDKLSGSSYKKAIGNLNNNPENINVAILKDIVNHNYQSKDHNQLSALHWIKRYINYYITKEKDEKQLHILTRQLAEIKSVDLFESKLSHTNEEIQNIKDILVEKPDSITLQESLEEMESTQKDLQESIRKHNDLVLKKNSLEKKISNSFRVEREDRDNYRKVLLDLYLAKEYIEEKYLSNRSPTERYFSLQYILDMPKSLNTLIVDEAQDYSLVELELLRLHTKRIVLTGDIFQNIQEAGEIDSWENILNVSDIYGVENSEGDYELNIFRLKHNFRQTYQLANASYNFRQLLLDGGLEDIEKEYYTSEKEFEGKPYSLPMIKFIQDDREIRNHIDSKILHIENTYSSRIPIALIYKDKIEKSRYQKILGHLKLAEANDDIEDSDVILLDILEAKGKEFPVVVSYLDHLSDNEIYLIMTRAQFELDFITRKDECINPKMQQLIARKWVETDGIKSLQLENLEKDTDEPSMDMDEDGYSIETENEQDGEFTIGNRGISKPVIEKINDHSGTIEQIKDEIDPTVILDEQKYKDTFLEHLAHLQELPHKKEVFFIRKEIDRDRTKVHNEIKIFLYQTYKGHCQSCGFTFRKTEDRQNSFEKFSWDDQRIVKVKKNFVSSAESLCLCRNCAANIKFGAFEPVFIQQIQSIEGFDQKNFEEIIELIHNDVDTKTPEIFADHTEFNDMFALKIRLNSQDRNLYFTKDHLMQFIIFLQLEEKLNSN